MEQEGNLMSDFQATYELGGDYGDCLVLNKHGDKYSLVAARKSKSAEGTVWMEWAFPQDKDKQPRAKAIPLGVRIGDRMTAIGALRWALQQLEGKPSSQPDEAPPF
jgi:hypothetical protein